MREAKSNVCILAIRLKLSIAALGFRNIRVDWPKVRLDEIFSVTLEGCYRTLFLRSAKGKREV